MAGSCGGVGGGGAKGGAVGGGGGAAGGVGGSKGASGSKSGTDTKSAAASNTAAGGTINAAAKTNNVDGAKAKAGIDREPQQKAELSAKVDKNAAAAKAATVKTETVKAEAVKAEKAKAATSAADSLKAKAKEFAAKAVEVAASMKKEFAKAQKQKELADLARKPQVKAMLDTLGFTEGTGLNYGKVVNGKVIGPNKKDMGFDADLKPGAKNVTTHDMSKHPNVKVQVNKNLVSSAAGRYQFLSKTWDNLSKTLGLKDFHATTQDIAAVKLMQDRGMIEPLMNGDLKTAVTRGSGEWASLPKADGTGAYTGQRAKSFEAIEQKYNDFLKDAEWKSMVNDFN